MPGVGRQEHGRGDDGRGPTDLPLALVLLGVAGAMVLTATGSFRAGGVALAATAALAAGMRLLLPVRTAGSLAVRTRFLDVLVLGVLALGVGVLALAVPDP